MSMIKHQLGYLVSGLVFWLPIWILVLVLSLVFGNVDRFVRQLIDLFFPGRFAFPGAGVLAAALISYVTGVLLKKTPIGDLPGKIPVVGVFFGRRKGVVITLDKLLNMTPCLFLFSPTCPSYGWILSDEEAVAPSGALYTLINVYYPNVPTIVTGQVFPVRKETVIRLGASSREVVDVLLYSLRSPEKLPLLPWPGESLEAFEQRASRFGLG
ncbi:MAG: hypothetical protein HYX95_03625 [Chloroflexi bacterium]|nr:hypothetical protein [Chloroflexota bacterium]